VREPIGLIEQPDGLAAVGALVPLGRLSGVQLTVLESAATLVFTPWRGIVVPDLTPAAAESWIAALAGAGLEVAGGSRWVGVTTCAGQPGCAKSLADVRHDAFAATTAGDGLPVHWVGCERGCGSPAGPHVRVEATGSGYVVRSPHACGFAPAGDATGGIATVSAATDKQANSGTAGGEAPTGEAAGADAAIGGMAVGDVGALIGAARKV
jgi:precorrin-3B synthase